jgi:hypothetical protein
MNGIDGKVRIVLLKYKKRYFPVNITMAFSNSGSRVGPIIS